MTETSLPSPEILRKLLRYEPDTGKLFWQERERDMFNSNRAQSSWNKRFSEKQAFNILTNLGYLGGHLLGKTYKAHRVIWAIEMGKWPPQEIDHIDGDKTNNKMCNLRLANRSQNNANTVSRKNSSSKYLGVHFVNRNKKWCAAIRKDRKTNFSGYFECEIEAAKAYDARAKELHGDFANLNFPEVLP